MRASSASVGDASTSNAGCPRCGVAMGRRRLFACTSQFALHFIFQPVAGSPGLQPRRRLPSIGIPYSEAGTSGRARRQRARQKLKNHAQLSHLDTVALPHCARKLHATGWRAGRHAASLGGVVRAVSVAGQRAWACRCKGSPTRGTVRCALAVTARDKKAGLRMGLSGISFSDVGILCHSWETRDSDHPSMFATHCHPTHNPQSARPH